MDAQVSDEFDSAGRDLELDNFLLEEGLEILAAYRSIRDKAVRLSLRQLINSLAEADLAAN